jgi:dipeptidyl aminopeptidase/acylaminoacyl peptidase
MLRSFRFFVVCVLLGGVATLPGQLRGHEITLDDYFTLPTIQEVVLSPDGRYVAYTVGRWQKASDDRKTDLWVVDCRTKRSRLLTVDRCNPHALAWDPSGKVLYFSAVRQRKDARNPPFDGSLQVWKVPFSGGDPQAVTRVPGGIRLFLLDRKGNSLWYTTDQEHITGPWANLKKRFSAVQYGHGVNRVSQVWELDLRTNLASKRIDDKQYVREMALSPGGSRLAMITAPDSTVVSSEGRSYVRFYDTTTCKVTLLDPRLYRTNVPSPHGWLEGLAWSPQGKSLAFNVIFDGHPAEIVVAEWVDGTAIPFRLSRPAGVSVRGYGSPLGWLDMADLCFLGEEKGRVRLCRIPEVHLARQEKMQWLTPGDVVVDDFSLDPGTGRAAVVMGKPDRFPEIYLVEDGKVQQLTHLNAHTARWELPQLSVVSWAGARGDTVEGILELPPSYRGPRDGPLPMVVILHGGPTTATRFHLRYWGYGRTLLAARGYAVLCPNYRGSTGYGDKFLTDLLGKENDIEVEDILSGVKAMVQRGLADPERLGVMGWSNGGYLTNCLITRTTQFKAASSGAGIVDSVMEWGINDEPAYTMSLKQGLPWEKPSLYQKTSPTYKLDHIRTPTLIHVGAEDKRCPPGHSKMLHRALKEYLGVPTELIVYPGETHGLVRYQSKQIKMTWDLAWFDHYLLGKKKD